MLLAVGALAFEPRAAVFSHSTVRAARAPMTQVTQVTMQTVEKPTLLPGFLGKIFATNTNALENRLATLEQRKRAHGHPQTHSDRSQHTPPLDLPTHTQTPCASRRTIFCQP